MASPTSDDPIEELSPSERRRHARVDYVAKARILRADGVEEPCLVVNISAGGALLKAKSPPEDGEHVVLYIDNVGRFEASVIRTGKHTFAVDYRARRSKSRRTADALIIAVNERGRRIDRRGAPRIRQEKPATVTFENGDTATCSILDISLTGASIEIDPKPPLGTPLVVGKMAAKVVRRHETGVGVVFTGAAGKMEEIISEAHSAAESPSDAPQIGLGFASRFGKKSP